VISEKVRLRVRQVARELDYHPSATAAGLARKRTRNVAVIFYRWDTAISNQFYSFVVQGAVKEAIEQEHNLLFSDLNRAYRGHADLPKVVQERNAEGVLLFSQIDARLVADIQSRGIPVVAIDNYPAVEGIDSLQSDGRRGGALAAEHLLELGHQRLAFLRAAADRPSIAERGEGFREALAGRGIVFSQRKHVIDCKSLSFEGAHEGLLRALRADGKLTAVFCANDEMAAGAVRAAGELGLRVPEDFSIVGFDDIVMSGFFNPPLTTISVMKEELGRRGMARLLDLVKGKGGRPERQLVPVELVVRSSTAAPRAEQIDAPPPRRIGRARVL
jgi:LacI family transcriptional regulator